MVVVVVVDGQKVAMDGVGVVNDKRNVVQFVEVLQEGQEVGEFSFCVIDNREPTKLCVKLKQNVK